MAPFSIVLNDCFAERFDDAEEAPRFQHPLPDGELGSTAQHAPSNGVRANESDWTHRTGGLSPLRLAVASRTQCHREGTFRQQHQWTALPGLAIIAILFCLLFTSRAAAWSCCCNVVVVGGPSNSGSC